MDLELDINDLTIDDVVDLEEAVGLPINQIVGSAAATQPQGKALKAIIWVIKRKSDPSFTFEDAGKVAFAELRDNEVEITAEKELDPQQQGG